MRQKNQNRTLSLEIAIRFKAKDYKIRVTGIIVVLLVAFAKIVLIWFRRGG